MVAAMCRLCRKRAQVFVIGRVPSCNAHQAEIEECIEALMEAVDLRPLAVRLRQPGMFGVRYTAKLEIVPISVAAEKLGIAAPADAPGASPGSPETAAPRPRE